MANKRDIRATRHTYPCGLESCMLNANESRSRSRAAKFRAVQSLADLQLVTDQRIQVDVASEQDNLQKRLPMDQIPHGGITTSNSLISQYSPAFEITYMSS